MVHLLYQTSSPGVVCQEVVINSANNEVLYFHLMNINSSIVIYIESFIKEIYFHLVIGNSQAISVSF